uniref:NADH dehydrogenase subunit 4L n=1 Tax=Glyphocrangon regalis TaxID=1616678 RepID=UPI0023D7D97E|nr:NADH dehydrogenase subunit 4L [Glyphocrangon regalis]WDD39097.1 NADH dehydrogenase subunit 4L [Glyphocrangon regalis]
MAVLSIFYNLSFFSILAGVLAFIGSRKHLLNILLSLEYIMLSIFWFMTIVMVNMGGEGYFVLFFLTFAVCEGALGLSLLVSIVRSHGNDKFRSFSLLKC